MAFVLNFNDRFFQKKNIKVTTDLEHWSEIILIFFSNSHVKMSKIQGRRPPCAKMKAYMKELGHFRTPKNLVF